MIRLVSILDLGSRRWPGGPFPAWPPGRRGRHSCGAHPDHTMSTGTISTPSGNCWDTCTAGDLEWEVPRLLGQLDQADDLYLDSITQVVMPPLDQRPGSSGRRRRLLSRSGRGRRHPAWRSSVPTCWPPNLPRPEATPPAASLPISKRLSRWFGRAG
jgi:hypothetical protein